MRLGVDYGSANTRAVLIWPDGRWTHLLFDGSPLLSSGVYAAPDGLLLTGQSAGHAAPAHPNRYVPDPKQHLDKTTLRVGERDVEVVDLIAATLKDVAAHATQVAGQPVDELTMTVPASWGPQRRTTLRRAATRAGLPQPTLIDTPVAVAARLLVTGTSIPVGAPILVCDLGAGGAEATVVRRTEAGFDVLSTIATPHAAGTLIDRALADHIATALPAPPTNAEQAPSVPADPAPDWVARARTAKETLAHQLVIATPSPAGPALILDQPTLQPLTHPVLTEAAKAIQTAITAADLSVEQLAGVYCTGGTSRLPWTGAVLSETLGVTPLPVPNPDEAPLLGALHATGPATAPSHAPAPAGRLSARHALDVLVPALASMVVLIQATATALPVPVPELIDRNESVIANWGEYAIAALLVVQAAIAAGLLAAAYLARGVPEAAPGAALAAARMLRGALPASASIGLTIAGLYAIGPALWYGVSNGPFLRWCLTAALPLAVLAIVIGLIAPWRPYPPATSWLEFLTVPLGATVLAAAGILSVQFGLTDTDPTTRLLRGPALFLGAAAFGLAIALVLPGPRSVKVIVAAPLAFVAILLTIGHGIQTLAVLYVLATTGRWLTRLAQITISSSGTGRQ